MSNKRVTKKSWLAFYISDLIIIFIVLLCAFYIELNIYSAQHNEIASKLLQPQFEIIKKNETLAEKLYREVRIVCIINTTPKYYTVRTIYVRNTWAKRCNHHIFISSANDSNFNIYMPPVEDKYENTWGKMKWALIHAYEQYYDKGDWFIKLDDDSYAILENLRYMLYEYSPETPIYFGHAFVYRNSYTPFMSGGSGYVLSREALKRFNEIGLKNPERCKTNDNAMDDLEMGNCLNYSTVIFGDSRDSKLRQRFLPFNIAYTVIANVNSDDHWYWRYNFYNVRTCRDCPSNYIATTHYITPIEMLTLDFLNYKMKVFGRVKPAEKLPRRLQTDEIIVPPEDGCFRNAPETNTIK